MPEPAPPRSGTITSYPADTSGLTIYTATCRHGARQCVYFDPGTAPDQTEPTDLFLDLIAQHDRQWPGTDCLVEAECVLRGAQIMRLPLPQP